MSIISPGILRAPRRRRLVLQPNPHQYQKNNHDITDLTHLTQLRKVNLQRLRVLLKPERDHRVQDILPADRFPLLHLTLLRRF